MKLLIARFGLDGLGAVIQLEQMVFREGYFCRWSKDAESLFIMENSTTKERLREILDYCLDNGIFDRTIFARKGILTSRDIQLQWLKICELSRRKSFAIAPELDLSTKQYEFAELQSMRFDTESNDNAQNGSETNSNGSEKTKKIERTLSKENEIKEKESSPEAMKGTYKRNSDSPLIRRLYREIEMKNKSQKEQK